MLASDEKTVGQDWLSQMRRDLLVLEEFILCFFLSKLALLSEVYEYSMPTPIYISFN